MPIPLIILVIVVFMVVVLFLRPRGAGSGTYAEVSSRLAKLKSDTDPNAFLGFHTRDEDALYFVYIDGVFSLDYELNTPKKKSHGEAFRKTATELGFTVHDATYGDFPVLRVRIDDSETHAAEAGFKFAQKLFELEEKTIVEFLP